MNMQTMSHIACEVKGARMHPVLLVGEDEVKGPRSALDGKTDVCGNELAQSQRDSGTSIKHPVVRQLLHHSKQNGKREGGTKVQFMFLPLRLTMYPRRQDSHSHCHSRIRQIVF